MTKLTLKNNNNAGKSKSQRLTEFLNHNMSEELYENLLNYLDDWKSDNVVECAYCGNWMLWDTVKEMQIPKNDPVDCKPANDDHNYTCCQNCEESLKQI